MEDIVKLIESLLERAAEYGKVSFELVKLKTLDRITDIVSSVIPLTVVILLITSFLLFLNLGLALWLGDVLGKTYYGFFALAAFYFLIAVVFHFFLHKWIKRLVGDYFIKHVLK
jgi:hypothetical protein